MDPWKDGGAAEARLLRGSYVIPRSAEFGLVFDGLGTGV